MKSKKAKKNFVLFYSHQVVLCPILYFEALFQSRFVIRKSNKNIPIIAITNYFVEGYKKEMKKSGCKSFLGKPVSKPQLLEAIIKQLKS